MKKKYDGNILNTIKNTPNITLKDLSEIFDQNTIDNQFAQLVRDGLIIVGKDDKLETKNV